MRSVEICPHAGRPTPALKTPKEAMTAPTGIIAIGKQGQIEFQAGLGEVPEIVAAVQDIDKGAPAAGQRLQALPSHKLIVLVLPVGGERTIYLLHDARDEETLL